MARQTTQASDQVNTEVEPSTIQSSTLPYDPISPASTSSELLFRSSSLNLLTCLVENPDEDDEIQGAFKVKNESGVTSDAVQTSNLPRQHSLLFPSLENEQYGNHWLESSSSDVMNSTRFEAKPILQRSSSWTHEDLTSGTTSWRVF